MAERLKVGARVKTRRGMGNVIDVELARDLEMVKVMLDTVTQGSADIVWLKSRDVTVLTSNGD